MTTNAFIFSWDIHGIESIVPISQYEHHDKQNLINILSEKRTTTNPLNGILQNLMLRARYNTHRHYEIYAVDCDSSLDENFWRNQWEEHPQYTADLIREKGHKLYSDRQTREPVIR
jgi:hypothetical protein